MHGTALQAAQAESEGRIQDLTVQLEEAQAQAQAAPPTGTPRHTP